MNLDNILYIYKTLCNLNKVKWIRERGKLQAGFHTRALRFSFSGGVWTRSLAEFSGKHVLFLLWVGSCGRGRWLRPSLSSFALRICRWGSRSRDSASYWAASPPGSAWGQPAGKQKRVWKSITNQLHKQSFVMYTESDMDNSMNCVLLKHDL